VVSPQHKRKDSSSRRTLNVMIGREKNQTDAQNISAEYGMVVEVDGERVMSHFLVASIQ
jgi:hypothetical protein